MPLQATSGAASYDAFGGGVAVVPNYIEDVFSTWLYTGTTGTQTITNGIDLSTKGGMVWIKVRNTAGYDNCLFDTTRGVNKLLRSNLTNAQTSVTNTLTSFNTTGFTLGSDNSGWGVNGSTSITYASWTYRKQPKFFDVVTYTGTGSNTTIAHNINGTVGCIIVKRTDTTGDWQVYHRSLTSAAYSVQLNTTNAQASTPTIWNSTAPTSTVFSVGTDASVNASGGTYVAYLFAHNAGGFGLTGTDNVISCGSFTTDGSGNATVSLGYEPQCVLFKKTSATGPWYLVDNMRAFARTVVNYLNPNNTGIDTEVAATDALYPTATGFGGTSAFLDLSSTYIYVAIRRGPMKVPTSGTSVFGMSARSGTGANATVTGGQTDDAVLIKNRGSAVASLFSSRLTGTGYLVPATTAAEVAAGTTILQANPWDVMDGVKVGTTDTITNATSNTYINYLFKRAPSFMDVVCYTGTGVATNFSHNLGAVPQLMFVKARTNAFATSWYVYNESLGATKTIFLDDDTSFQTNASFWNNTTPTSSVFTIGTNQDINSSGYTNIAYLFATCAGVSKVGSYTGNGSTQTIDCGITAGARFVLIRRTNSTGSWYVYDTARGMTTLTDPYWLADTTAAEVATLGSVTTVATGFALNSSILAAINLNASTYIFLAIA